MITWRNLKEAIAELNEEQLNKNVSIIQVPEDHVREEEKHDFILYNINNTESLDNFIENHPMCDNEFLLECLDDDIATPLLVVERDF